MNQNDCKGLQDVIIGEPINYDDNESVMPLINSPFVFGRTQTIYP